MPLSAEVDEFVKVASASLPRVSEIIAALPDEDRAGAFEFAERRYAHAARDFGCDEAKSKRWVTALMGARAWKYRDMIGYTSVGAGSSIVPGFRIKFLTA